MNKLIELVDVYNKETIYKGIGNCKELKNGGREISFGNSNHQFSYKVWPKGCVIESKQECSVVLSLRLNAKTIGHIYSEFGQMDVSCQTTMYEVEENKIEVKYALGEDQFFHFRLYIHDEEEEYAIH